MSASPPWCFMGYTTQISVGHARCLWVTMSTYSYFKPRSKAIKSRDNARWPSDVFFLHIRHIIKYGQKDLNCHILHVYIYIHIHVYIYIYIYIYIYTCIYIYVYIYQLLYITESTNVCNYAEDTMFHVCDSDIRNLVSRLEHDSVLATERLEHRHAFTKVWEGRMC